MSDRRLRELERAAKYGDISAAKDYYASLVRQGYVSAGSIELASYLGDRAASSMVGGDEVPEDIFEGIVRYSHIYMVDPNLRFKILNFLHTIVGFDVVSKNSGVATQFDLGIRTVIAAASVPVSLVYNQCLISREKLGQEDLCSTIDNDVELLEGLLLDMSKWYKGEFGKNTEDSRSEIAAIRHKVYELQEKYHGWNQEGLYPINRSVISTLAVTFEMLNYVCHTMMILGGDAPDANFRYMESAVNTFISAMQAYKSTSWIGKQDPWPKIRDTVCSDLINWMLYEDPLP